MVKKLLPILLSLCSAASYSQDEYNCDLPDYADFDSKSWAVQDFKFRIAVDTTENKAYMIGNAGVSEMIIVPSPNGITFIEITDVGNVITTTIDESGNAVHSRNVILFGGLIASQLFGKCIKE